MVFFEIGDGGLPRWRLTHILELVFADFDHVVAVEDMFFYGVAIDQCTVGAAEIFQK
jgi:hypothetical protein